jgi:hypothetical protein
LRAVTGGALAGALSVFLYPHGHIAASGQTRSGAG